MLRISRIPVRDDATRCEILKSQCADGVDVHDGRVTYERNCAQPLHHRHAIGTKGARITRASADILKTNTTGFGDCSTNSASSFRGALKVAG